MSGATYSITQVYEALAVLESEAGSQAAIDRPKPAQAADVDDEVTQQLRLLTRECKNTLDDRREWVNLGTGMKVANESLRDDFIAFSERWGGETTDGEAERVWNSIKPRGEVTAATAFYLLRRSDPETYARHETAALQWPSLPPSPSAVPPRGAEFPLVPIGQLEFREPEFLIDGILEAGTLALAFGEPESAKSFIALDAAFCIATGRPFHGREVRQGAVIYLAGEGHSGIARRRIAWEKHTGQRLDETPMRVSKVAAQLLDRASAAAVEKAVDEAAAELGDIALIVIDTLARNFGGGDENDTKDMSAFVQAVDSLKGKYGAAALIVHHTGHGDKSRSRGSIAMKAALDHEYRVEKSGSHVTVTNTKMKDAAPPVPMGFRLESVVVGTNRKGEDVTSAVLVEDTARATRPQSAPKLTPAQEEALKSFTEACQRSEADPAKGIHINVWRPVFYEMSAADGLENKRKRFERGRKELIRSGMMTVTHDLYRRPMLNLGT